jgi:hypothetical protein
MAMASCFPYYYKPPAAYWKGEGVYAETLTLMKYTKLKLLEN